LPLTPFARPRTERELSALGTPFHSTPLQLDHDPLAMGHAGRQNIQVLVHCYLISSVNFSGCSRLCIGVGLPRFTRIKTINWCENWDYTRNSWRRCCQWSHIINQGCCFTPGAVGICGGRGLLLSTVSNK